MGNFCHLLGVRKKSPKVISDQIAKRPKLVQLLIRRVLDIQADKGISDNGIAKNAEKVGYVLGQSTVSRILRGEQDPSVGILEAIAAGLNVLACDLLDASKAKLETKPAAAASQQNLVTLPRRYEPTFPKKATHGTAKSRKTV